MRSPRDLLNPSAAALVAALAALPAGSATAAPAAASYVVRAEAGASAQVVAAIARLGGEVGVRLEIINGFEATLPAGAAATLRGLDGVVSVSENARVRPLAASFSPASDTGSLQRVTTMTGARDYWRAGFTGKGIDVAVIDSGAAPVDGLVGADKVLDGPDLSFESQNPALRYADTFGHGTHMSGIIAGRAQAARAPYADDQSSFLGMAPDARIVSLKVADARGGTDVSQVIAAIDWVVQHRNAPGLNIRVLNLSYGTDSTQDYVVDPLAYAAEVAWQSGIVVVASAGNAGFVQKTGSLTLPAADPHIIAVGATNPNGTDDPTDDTVAGFSSTGSKNRKPDLLAPGKSIVSLRVPGSFTDQTHAASGAVDDELFRGSGTSQAAAVVSGAVALLLDQRPNLAPDDVKAILTKTATRLPKVHDTWQGSGTLNLRQALVTEKWGSIKRKPFSTGGGSLDRSRGTKRLIVDGRVLDGERDIFGNPVSTADLARLQATRSSWSNGQWSRSTWSGDGWTKSSWSSSGWSRSSWSAGSWTKSSWSGRDWNSNAWSSGSWTGSSWTSGSWLHNDWSSGTWSSDVWDADEWR